MFTEYIAKDRSFDDFTFDFLITNATAQLWYDSSANQSMPERVWCLSNIKPGFTIVDCGAHHGMMSVLFALATGRNGRVVAYEALPENAKVIVRNAELNGLSNVTVRPVGLGAASANLSFHYNQSNSMLVAEGGTEIVTIVRLDDDLDSTIKVDFLKIDVEGHDVEAIQGMKRVIAQRPIIDLEIHNFLFSDVGASLEKIGNALSGYMFSILGEITGEVKDLGEDFDVSYIKQFANPHIFCTPR